MVQANLCVSLTAYRQRRFETFSLQTHFSMQTVKKKLHIIFINTMFMQCANEIFKCQEHCRMLFMVHLRKYEMVQRTEILHMEYRHFITLLFQPQTGKHGKLGGL